MPRSERRTPAGSMRSRRDRNRRARVRLPRMLAAQPDVLAEIDAAARLHDQLVEPSRLARSPGAAAGRSTASVQPSSGNDSGPP